MRGGEIVGKILEKLELTTSGLRTKSCSLK